MKKSRFRLFVFLSPTLFVYQAKAPRAEKNYVGVRPSLLLELCMSGLVT